MSSSGIGAKKLLGFGSYDFSNSGYVLIFQSFLFPVFFADSLRSWTDTPETFWGIAIAMSTILAILVAPRVGALGDRVGRGGLFTLCVIGSGGVAILVAQFGGAGPLVVILGFLVFNALFEISQSLYDSFLTTLTRSLPDTIKLSSFAWGFGYLGGALFAGAYLLLEKQGPSSSSLLTIFAAAYLALSIPAVLFLRGHETVRRKVVPGAPATSFRQAIGLIFQLRTQSPVTFKHLLVYWLVVDAVAGVMYFAPLFLAREVGLSTTMVGALLLAAQVFAAPATYLVGLAAIRWGLVLVIRLTLIGWIAALVGIFAATSLSGVIAAMVPMVFVIGSTQALLRAHFSQHVADEMPGEGFGYYAVAQKSAAVMTPLLVAGVVFVTGGLRAAFVLLALVIFVAGWLAAYLPVRRVEPRPAP